ncbi:MAG: type II toxin-antitoxin system prevent-host-death family antitoxin [Polyangia bacterium]
METVNIHDAKTHLSRLLRRVAEGEEVLIARRGEVVARLCPPAPPARRRPGLLEGRVDEEFFEPLSEEELAAWE